MAVVDAVLPTIQCSAWCTSSEMIIQTHLCSDDIQERRADVQKIIDLKSAEDDVRANFSICARKMPLINARAFALLELIDLSEGVHVQTDYIRNKEVHW
ncbi:hypothetical protein E2320_019727 [Naja naja]|nr:hypothetical protein E2320_019727 [Naja naja]